MITIVVKHIQTDHHHFIQTAEGEVFTAPRKVLRLLYNNVPLSLVLYKEEPNWEPATFYHASTTPCPFCKGRERTECNNANRYLSFLYKEVLASKSYRLPALLDVSSL